MTTPRYKSGKSIIMAVCYQSGNNDDKSDNNKDKIYLLLKRWILVGHVLDHILDHILEHVLDYTLDQVLNHVIISLMTIALHRLR